MVFSVILFVVVAAVQHPQNFVHAAAVAAVAQAGPPVPSQHCEGRQLLCCLELHLGLPPRCYLDW